eukprot:6453695-Prymnesium_polylepis.1
MGDHRSRQGMLARCCLRLTDGRYGECELYDITHANSGHSNKYGYDFTDGNSDRDVKSQNA